MPEVKSQDIWRTECEALYTVARDALSVAEIEMISFRVYRYN